MKHCINIQRNEEIFKKNKKNEFVDKFLSYVDYQSYAVQTHKQEIDHMFEEFLMDKQEIRKKDLEREREENENNFKKRITIIEKEEKKEKIYWKNIIG